MDNKKVLRDRETGEELSLEEIRIEYAIMKATDATEAETFEDYLSNITDRNGTCEWIEDSEEWHKCAWCGDNFPESDLREEKDLGYLCEHCILAISSRGEDLYLKY